MIFITLLWLRLPNNIAFQFRADATTSVLAQYNNFEHLSNGEFILRAKWKSGEIANHEDGWQQCTGYEKHFSNLYNEVINSQMNFSIQSGCNFQIPIIDFNRNKIIDKLHNFDISSFLIA